MLAVEFEALSERTPGKEAADERLNFHNLTEGLVDRLVAGLSDLRGSGFLLLYQLPHILAHGLCQSACRINRCAPGVVRLCRIVCAIHAWMT